MKIFFTRYRKIFDLLSAGVGDHGQDGVHGERQVHVAGRGVRVARGLGGRCNTGI